MTETIKLSEDEFNKRYRPLNDRPLKEDEIPAGTDKHHIWTQVQGDDDDDEHYVLVNGHAVVDRIGYWITIVPWVDGDDIEVIW